MLAKIMEGNHYELHLQMLMQLAVLLKHGGTVVQLGRLGTSSAAAAPGTNETWVAKDALTAAAVTANGGLLAVSVGELSSAAVRAMMSHIVGWFPSSEVGPYKLIVSKPELKAPLVSALLKCDEPLSNVAFRFLTCAATPRGLTRRTPTTARRGPPPTTYR
jgi:hypothetical protein